MAVIGSYTWSAHKNRRHGPWLIGSNLYALFISGANVQMFKSTNGGDTWTTAGAGVPPVSGKAWVGVSGVVSGTTIHAMLVQAEENNNGESYATFDTTSDTWTTIVAAIDGPSTEIRGAAGASYGDVYRRSNGEIIIAHTYKFTSMGSGYARAAWGRWVSGTTLATASALVDASTAAAHDQPRASVLAGDRLHMFWTVDASNTLLHRAVTTSNTFGTAATIDSTVIGTAIQTCGQATAFTYLGNTRIIVPYIDANGDLRVAYATSADTPTWSTALLTSTNRPEYVNSNPASLAYDGTVLRAFWVNDAQTAIYTASSSDGGATWGAQTAIISGLTAVQGISTEFIGNSTFGILYTNNGTVNYSKYPEATVIPVSVSDTDTISVSESLSIATTSTLSLSDTDTISETSSYSATANVTLTDTTTITEAPLLTSSGTATINDGGTILSADDVMIEQNESFLELFDPPLLGTFILNESLLGALTVSATEGITIELMETVIEVTLSDSGTLSETPTFAIDTLITGADTATIGGADVATPHAELVSSDSDTLTADETLSSASALDTSDTATLAASDVSSILTDMTLSISDSGSVAATETFVTASTIELADAATIPVSEDLASSSMTALNDSNTITSEPLLSTQALLDTSSEAFIGSVANLETLTSSTLTLGDNVALGASQTLSGHVLIEPADSATIDATEDRVILVSVTGDDESSIAATDELVSSSLVETGDAGTLDAVENASVVTTEVFLDVEDTVTLSELSSYEGDALVAVADSDTIAAAEQLNILGDDQVSLSDTAMLDTTPTFATEGTLSASDEGTTSVEEAISFFLTTSRDDETLIAATDTLVLDVALEANDDTTLGATESFDTLGEGETLVSDTGTIETVEMLSLVAVIELADADTIADEEQINNEATSDISDAAMIAAGETFDAEIASGLSLSDILTLTITESMVLATSMETGESPELTTSEQTVASAWTTLTDDDTLTGEEVYLEIRFSTQVYTDVSSLSSVEAISSETTASLGETTPLTGIEELVTADSETNAVDDVVSVGAAESFLISVELDVVDNLPLSILDQLAAMVTTELDDQALVDVIETFERIDLTTTTVNDAVLVTISEGLSIETGSIIYPDPFAEQTPIELTKLNNIPFLRSSPRITLRKLDTSLPYLRAHGMMTRLYTRNAIPFLRKADDD